MFVEAVRDSMNRANKKRVIQKSAYNMPSALLQLEGFPGMEKAIKDTQKRDFRTVNTV